MQRRVGLIFLCISFLHVVGQDTRGLLTSRPNPSSSGRPEVNSGFVARIPVLARPPAITNSGDLSDWEGAYRVERAFTAFKPVPIGEPKVRGDLYLGWGPDGLYVAVQVFCDPREVVGSVQGRDRVQAGQDGVFLTLDAQGNGQSAVILCVNPCNVQRDYLYVEGGVEDASFDMIWKSGAAITPEGWVAKFKVPFAALRRGGRDWNLSAGLSLTRGGTDYTLSYPQKYPDVQCTICQSVHLAGAPAQNHEDVLMVAPRLYQEREASAADGTLHHPSVENRNGVDFRYQTTRFAIEGTYRPDFATIDADVNPLNINNRFKYQYADKRPFFMSGMDVFGDFASSLNVLSTRSIIDPTYGLKGTGQDGPLAWNLMVTRDAHGGDSISTDGLADVGGRETSDVAFGATYGFGPETRTTKVTLVSTDRRILGGELPEAGLGYSNTTGLSLYQQLGRNWSLTTQGVQSRACLPSTEGDTVPARGTGTNVALNGVYSNFSLSAFSATLSPDLRMDMGFIPLSGTRETSATGTFTLRNRGFWNFQYLTLVSDRMDEWSGSPLLRSTTFTYQIGLKGPLVITVNQSVQGEEWWGDARFDTPQTTLTVLYGGLRGTGYQVRLTGSCSVSRGIEYSREVADREVSPSAIVNANLGPVFLNAQWTCRSIYDRYSGDLFTRATRLYLFVEQSLPFNLFWRVQYQPVRTFSPLATNPQLRVDTSRTSSVQWLVGWRPDPFSGFYLGYNAIHGTNPLAPDPREERLTQKGVFAKATYAFQF